MRCCWSVVSIVGQHLKNDVLCVLAHMRYQLCNALELARRKLKLHVCCNFLELVDQLLWRGSNDVMDLVYLIELVLTGK